MFHELFSYIGVILLFSFVYSSIKSRFEETLAIFVSVLILVFSVCDYGYRRKDDILDGFLLFLFTIKKPNAHNKGQSFWKNLVFFGVIGLFWFGYFGYLNLDFFHENDGMLRMADKDLVFYANLSTYIQETGVESYLTHNIHHQNPPLLPYHYWDIYLTALFSFLFDLPPLKSLMFVVTPFSMTIVSAIICTLLRPLNRVGVFHGPF